MPIYEYQCDACGHTMDALQKISDDPLKLCPECGAESLRKLLSAPNFRLKGTGWYETDFKTGNRKNVVDDGSKKDGAKDASGNKAADAGKGGDKAATGSGGGKAASGKAASGKTSPGKAASGD
ncbi:MAG: zinc ribbon domain-containing protein [Pseudomonadota bacterium]